MIGIHARCFPVLSVFSAGAAMIRIFNHYVSKTGFLLLLLESLRYWCCCCCWLVAMRLARSPRRTARSPSAYPSLNTARTPPKNDV